MAAVDGNMLKGAPFGDMAAPPTRQGAAYNPLDTFALPKGADKHYTHQFADMYFLRLSRLKPAVKQVAQQAWADFELAGEKAAFVDRVLDVRQGELCWVVGTVYMEMALKPNVLDDISKEHWIVAPPPRHTYLSPEGQDEMMLEDESGRLRISGEGLSGHYVTGCVIAALGTEQADGSFQVIATQYPDLPRQPARWERDGADKQPGNADKQLGNTDKHPGKIAFVSGLDISGTDDDDLSLDLLAEYLTGEATGPPSQHASAQMTRLIIAGDSLSHSSPILSRDDFAAKKAKKHYGYDASVYNPAPTTRFDAMLSSILSALPVTLLPGASDPANVALPQQPLHPALFPTARLYASPLSTPRPPAALDAVTNPWSADVSGYRFLGTSGQPTSDLLKYLPDTISPLDAMELSLRWRCVAPTAPDTLVCYPFQDEDPLLVSECPHVYFAGNQDRLGIRWIHGPDGQKVLLLAIPRFSQSGQLALLDLETFEVDVVQVGVVRPGID